MKTAVITCAVFPTEEIARQKMWIFLKSAELQEIDALLYGVGTPWKGYKYIKLDLQLHHLKQLKGHCTHVLYTDGWDAMFLGSLQTIQHHYQLYGSPPILVSAYRGLGNVSEPDKDYPNCFDQTKLYRYPNVGGYIAEIDAIIDAFERMTKMERQTGDDCFNWYDAWKEGWFRPELDYLCKIFQVTDEHTAIAPYKGEPRILNTMTGTYPCIIHLCGGFTSPRYGKDDRMIPVAKSLDIISYEEASKAMAAIRME